MFPKIGTETLPQTRQIPAMRMLSRLQEFLETKHKTDLEQQDSLAGPTHYRMPGLVTCCCLVPVVLALNLELKAVWPPPVLL